MAAGAPLIASDIEPHRALLGESAPELLVDFDDPDAVAAAVDRLLRADRASTEETGARLRAASDPYDIERLVAEIATLYERFTPAE
jgi:glycosyltransferase involved in cell wall biosynthesis